MMGSEPRMTSVSFGESDPPPFFAAGTAPAVFDHFSTIAGTKTFLQNDSPIARKSAGSRHDLRGGFFGNGAGRGFPYRVQHVLDRDRVHRRNDRGDVPYVRPVDEIAVGGVDQLLE
jgi:hypothetical protein